MKPIEYDVILDNVKTMINLLEFDAMRSSGKAKMNSQHLHSLYELEDRYTAKIKANPKPKVKVENKEV